MTLKKSSVNTEKYNRQRTGMPLSTIATITFTHHQKLTLPQIWKKAGFYLASWGMYRGSSFILGKSSKIFVPLIEYISSQREHHCEVWEIDVDKYTDENIALLIEQYGNIRSIIIKNKNAHLTLVTKVMLGVFAPTPAFDQYFIKSFGATFKGKSGFRSFNKKSLQCLNEFYLSNKEIIDSTSNDTKTICFESGEPSNLHYSKAKIIDMYGYTNRS